MALQYGDEPVGSADLEALGRAFWTALNKVTEEEVLTRAMVVELNNRVAACERMCEKPEPDLELAMGITEWAQAHKATVLVRLAIGHGTPCGTYDVELPLDGSPAMVELGGPLLSLHRPHMAHDDDLAAALGHGRPRMLEIAARHFSVAEFVAAKKNLGRDHE